MFFVFFYRFNTRFGRGVSVTKAIKRIGVCCTTAHKEPVKPIIDSLAKLVKENGQYRVIVFHCFEDLYYGNKNDIGARSVFEVINYDMLDAMIIFSCGIHDEQLLHEISQKCVEHGVLAVSVDKQLDGAFRVYFGDGEVFGTIVEHVITEHNCRRIKMLAGIRNNEFSQTRVNSCAEVMARHGLTLEEKDVMYGDFWEQPTYAAMDEFFASGEPLPDAFICSNDTMAMAVCLKLNEKGYKVPEDVIVTGYDGIEMEKYHNPRLCTAVQDNDELVAAIMDIVGKASEDKTIKPYDTELFYKAVFSESCGCKVHDRNDSNRKLTDFVNSYASSRMFEEHMDVMENSIAANPTPDNVRQVLRKYGLGNSALCITENFRQFFEGEENDKVENIGYPQKMSVFVSTFEDNSQPEGTLFDSAKLLPDMEHAFGEYNTIYVIPTHFQDTIIGYLVTPYCALEHHNERMYTYTMTLNRCLETMRIHEHMSMLNRRLSFLFTHDQLTGIYNRYGFYENFRKEIEQRLSCKDVFIVSADLNDMKYINDNYGHSAGDDALIITAKTLIGAAEGDENIICARFGGDEFVVARICSGDAAERGERYHENFNRVLKELNESSGYPFEVHISIGVYSAQLNGVDNIDSLIELADRLMYTDKARYKRHPRNLV